ncbi:MAG: ABC transporter substrate-binding protein [Spirochaetia bacterium]|jgi:lactose/L-arabinose transport system substrate-binding protein
MKRVVFALMVVLAIAVFVPGVIADAKTVTIWYWDPNFNGFSMKQAALVYNKIHPDVTIDIVDIPQNIEGKIMAGLQASGAGLPDIALFQDFRIEQFIANYPGAFVDLKAAGVDYSKFAQYKVGVMSDKGKVYGIPFDTGSTGYWLRADMLKSAGLNPDSYKKNMTWSQLIQLGVTVKAKTGKPIMAYDNTNFDILRIMVQSAGAQFFNADGTLNLETPAVTKSLAVLKDMDSKGLLYHADGWNNWVSAFNNGDTAGFLQALWIIGTLKTKPENAGNWMVVPTPLLEGVNGAQNASNNGGSSWYVFSASPNKDLAVDFLKTAWASSAPDALQFYNIILKGAGAMGTYLPSRTGSNYTAPDSYFYKSQPVFKDFAAWMEKVPALRYTPNYAAMNSAFVNALPLMFKGDLKTPDEVIAHVEQEYKQTAGQ